MNEHEHERERERDGGAEGEGDGEQVEGLVVRVDAHACLVELPSEAEPIRCQLRGRLFEESRRQRTTKPVVVGDRVLVQRLPEGDGALETVLERRTKLSRRAADKDGIEHVVVANVDTLVIVAAVKDPVFRSRLVDRFLVAGWRGGLEPLLCLNKTDLVGDDDPALREITELYSGLGVPVLPTSAATGAGVDRLREFLTGKISVFAGASGVGKSTLLMEVAPGLDLATKKVGAKSRKGRHTTTAVSLYRIEGVGHIVDTPGIRGLGIWDVGPEDLDAFFPEVFDLAEGCKYRGCSHTHEPGCAVKSAVEEGDLKRVRYESYRRILESLEE